MKLKTLIYSAIVVIACTFNALAKEYNYAALSERIKKSEQNQISLKGLQPISIFDKLHWPCRLGDSVGVDLGKNVHMNNPNAKLVRKVEMGNTTWVLQGMISVDEGSCKNGTAFRLDEKGNIQSLSTEWQNLRNVIIDYAVQSCLIKDIRPFSFKRSLTNDEATAVADCINIPEMQPYQKLVQKYSAEIAQTYRGVKDEMAVGFHCARDLFKAEKNPRVLDCDQKFLEMISAVSIAENALIACTDVANDKREEAKRTAALAICPPEKHADFGKSSGFSKVFYADGLCGFDRMQLESEREIEKSIPEKIYGCHFIDKKTSAKVNKGSKSSSTSR